MKLGNDTVTVVTIGEDLDDRDPFGTPAETRVETTVTGCHFRPLPAGREVTTDGGERVVDPHKLTAPPVDVLVTAKTTDRIRVNGVEYVVVGLPRLHTDMRGRPHHVTVEVARTLG